MKLQAFQKDVWGLHEAIGFYPASRSATIDHINNSLAQSIVHPALQAKCFNSINGVVQRHAKRW